MSFVASASYNDRMSSKLSEFLRALALEAKHHEPFLAEKLALFEQLKAQASEKKPTGGATGRARQALQKLRNVLLGSTHRNVAKRESAFRLQNTASELAKAIVVAVNKYGVHEIARLEYELHNGETASDFSSRAEKSGEVSRDLAHFLSSTSEYDVSEYMLGRLKDYQIAFISRLIVQANNDRHYEAIDNEWPLLLRHGFLNAYQRGLTEDEARALTQVATVRSDPELLVLQEKFESKFGQRDLTPGFMAACQRLLDAASELTHHEDEALFDAAGMQRSQQAEYLRVLLGLSLDETAKVDAFVRVIEDPTWESADNREDLNRRLIVNALLLHFNDLDAQGAHPSDWLPKLAKTLLAENGFIARHVPSEAAFWSLYFAALELSTFRNREEVRFLRQRKDADQATRDALTDYYLRNAMTHHVDENGVPWLGDDPDRQINDDLDEPTSDYGHSLKGERHCAVQSDANISDAEFTPCDKGPARNRRSSVAEPWSDEIAGVKSSADRQSRFEEFE